MAAVGEHTTDGQPDAVLRHAGRRLALLPRTFRKSLPTSQLLVDERAFARTQVALLSRKFISDFKGVPGDGLPQMTRVTKGAKCDSRHHGGFVTRVIFEARYGSRGIPPSAARRRRVRPQFAMPASGGGTHR